MIHQGHALDVLRDLPDESVQCVVTSPPYWGLRDYGLPDSDWPEVRLQPVAGVDAEVVGAAGSEVRRQGVAGGDLDARM